MYLLRVIKLSIVVSAFLILILCGVQQGDKSIHRLLEFFPVRMPFILRKILIAGILLSFLALGIIPFVWILLVLMYPACQRKQKKLLIIIIFFLITLPLVQIARSHLISISSPLHRYSLVSKTIRSGYSQELEELLFSKVNQNRHDRHYNIGCAVIQLKKGRPYEAQSFIQRALQQEPHDPVVLNIAGVCAIHNYDHSTARKYFERCIDKFPKYPAAYFNLGKLELHNLQAVNGLALIRKATALSPFRVNRHILKNDTHFPDSVPALRDYLITDFPPKFAWKMIVREQSTQLLTPTLFWGDAFLGFTPLISLYLFLALGAGLILLDIFLRPDPANPPRIHSCDTCGITICRRCSNNRNCPRCEQATTVLVTSGQGIDSAKTLLKKSFRKRTQKILTAISIIVPGGLIANGRQKQFWLHALLVLLTSLVISATITLCNWPFTTHFRIVEGICRIPVIIATTLYGTYVLIRLLQILTNKPQERST